MPTGADQKELDYCKEVFMWCQNARRPIESRIVQYLKAYRAWDDNYKMYERLYGGMGWRSTLFFPIVFSNIETLVPKIVMAIAGEPDFMALEATEENDQELVEPFETILKRQWEHAKTFDECTSHIKGHLINGFNWSKYGWLYEEENRQMDMPIVNLWGMRLGRKKVDRRIILINRPHLTALPPERVYWDPTAKSYGSYTGEDCLVVIDRYFANKRFIDDMGAAKVWKNTGDVDYGKTAEYREELESTRKMLHNETQTEAMEFGVKEKTNPYFQQSEIIEVYGLSATGKKRWLTVMANRHTLVHSDKNPHIDPPFIYTKNSHLAGQFTGTSETEYALPLNLAINELRNLHIDNTKLRVNGMWKVSRNADIDYNQLISRPWGIVETSDMEGIEPLQLPEMSQDAVIEARQLEQDVQTGTGVVDLLRGMAIPGFGDTATGIERLVGNASARFGGRIVSCQLNFTKEYIHRMMGLNVMNLPAETAVRIAGRAGLKFVKFRVDNIKGRFDIIVRTPNEMVNKAVQVNQLLVLYNLLRGDPQIDQRALKHLLITKAIPGAEGRLIMPDTEELEPDEENIVMSNSGLVMPLPNEDHTDHVRNHMKFIQDHEHEMDEQTMKIFKHHINMHINMQMSVYAPSNAPSPFAGLMGPESLGGGNSGGGGMGRGGMAPDGGEGGGSARGQLGGISDILSAVGGGSGARAPRYGG